MSTQRKPEYVEEQLSEEAVHEFLEANPDFFERHGALLGQLELPHGTGGAISPVERQVSMLRQKELKLQRQLKELIDVARDNDTLASKIHQLTLQLLAAPDLQACVSAVEEGMRSGFGADHSILVLFSDPTLFEDIEGGRFFRVIDRKDKALGPFDTFLSGKGPRCGLDGNGQIAPRRTRRERRHRALQLRLRCAERHLDHQAGIEGSERDRAACEFVQRVDRKRPNHIEVC